MTLSPPTQEQLEAYHYCVRYFGRLGYEKRRATITPEKEKVWSDSLEKARAALKSKRNA